MLTFVLLVEIVPFIALLTVSVCLVLCRSYNDTLLQRLGLSGMALGSLLYLLAEYEDVPHQPAITVIAYGAVFFAIGTAIKLCVLRRQENRRKPS